MEDGELEEGEISDENGRLGTNSELKKQNESHKYTKRASSNHGKSEQRYSNQVSIYNRSKVIRPKNEMWNNCQSPNSFNRSSASWRLNYRKSWHKPNHFPNRNRMVPKRRTISPRRPPFSMRSSHERSLPQKKKSLPFKSNETIGTGEGSYDELLAEYQKIKTQLKTLKEEELRTVHMSLQENNVKDSKNAIDKENEVADDILSTKDKAKNKTENNLENNATEKSYTPPLINQGPKSVQTERLTKSAKRRRRRHRARSNSNNAPKQDEEEEINELELRRIALESAATRKKIASNRKQCVSKRTSNSRNTQQHKKIESRKSQTSSKKSLPRTLPKGHYLRQSKEILLINDPNEQYRRFMNMVTTRGTRSQSSSHQRSRSPTPSSGKPNFTIGRNKQELEKKTPINDLLDNYEEVAMDIDSSNEDASIYTSSVVNHKKDTSLPEENYFPPLPSEPYPFISNDIPLPPDAPLPDDSPEDLAVIKTEDNDDEADVEALRELLISSMARKRMERNKRKPEVDDVTSNIEPEVKLEPTIEETTVDSVGNDNVPLNKISKNLKAQVPKPKIPQHQPIVINLAEDSSDSDESQPEDRSQNVNNAWQSGLDQLLKQARQTVEVQVNTSIAKDSNTPKAMYDLPQAHLLEYRRLKLEIERREKLKKAGSSTVSPVTSDVEISEIDKIQLAEQKVLEKKLREGKNKLIHHRENMQIELLLLKKLKSQITLKKSYQRAAELKVQKVKEQLVAAEKIVVANREVIQKLNEQTQLIQSRVDQNFILEKELQKNLQEANKLFLKDYGLQSVTSVQKRKLVNLAVTVGNELMSKKLKTNHVISSRKVLPLKKVSVLSITNPNKKVISNARPRMTQEEIAHEKERLQKLEQQYAERIRHLKAATLVKPQKKTISTSKEVSKELKLNPNRTHSLLTMNSTKPDLPNLNVVQKNNSSSGNLMLVSVNGHNSVKDAETKESQNSQEKDFIMPTGQQMDNLVRLQKERLENAATFEQPEIAQYLYNTVLRLFQPDLPKLQALLVDSLSKSSSPSYVNSNIPLVYSSPLLCFRSYRFSPYFRTKEGFSLSSSLLAHKINPFQAICSFDLMGSCNDDKCSRQHFHSMSMSTLDLFKDYVSFCPYLSGIDDATNLEDYSKIITTYAEKLLKLNESKMSSDELCLLLVSKVNQKLSKAPHYVCMDARKWSPAIPKYSGVEAESDLEEDCKKNKKKIDWLTLPADLDLDSIIEDQDVRYFAWDNHGLQALESAVLNSPKDIQLWLKLAYKWLHYDKSEPAINLDHALNVLSRALEANYQNSDLWIHYLTLYSKREDFSDLGELWEQALQLAPSYRLWWKYLQMCDSYSKKCDGCQKIIQYLINADNTTLPKLKSTQILEILLYQVQLNVLTGRYKTALANLQHVLSPGRTSENHIMSHLLPSDCCLLWLCYLHLLEFHCLPSCLYDPNNDGPSHIVSKEPFLLPWKQKHLVRTPLETLKSVFKTAIKSCCEKKYVTHVSTEISLPLYRNLIQLELTCGRIDDAISICEQGLKLIPNAIELWIILAKIKSINGSPEDVAQVFKSAIDKNPLATQLYHTAAKYHITCSNPSTAVDVLTKCAHVFYQENSYEPWPLYDHLLGEPWPLNVQQPEFSSSVTQEIITSEALYLRLNKCLLLSLQSSHIKTIKEFEAALGSQLTMKDTQALWLEFLQFYISRQVIFNPGDKLLLDLICHCVQTTTTRLVLPCDSRSYWIDYNFPNCVIELFISCLPSDQVTITYKKFLQMMPNNVQLKQRFLQHMYHLKDWDMVAYICRTLDEHTCCLALWRIAINMALKENHIKEAQRLFRKAVEALPFAVTLWKDLVLFEVTQGEADAINQAIHRCHKLQLNIDEFLLTLSGN